MLKVLVTGACGRLGSQTTHELVADGRFEVRAADRIKSPKSPLPVEVANLLDRESCYHLVEGVDAIVHLANHPSPSSGDAQTVFAENNAINVNIFQAAVESGVNQILFASSIQAIFGKRTLKENAAQDRSNLPYLPIDGDIPPCTDNTYGVSKIAGEALLRMYTQTGQLHSATALRFPVLLRGGWMRKDSRAKKEPFIQSHGHWYHPDEAFTYLSIPDAARLILAILLNPQPGLTIAQPGADELFTGMSMSEAMTYFQGVPLRKPVEKMTSLVDLDVLKRLYGWVPQEKIFSDASGAD